MPWKEVLSMLLTEGAFRTQDALVRALQDKTGRELNQATVSRELHALGARKVGGIYRMPPPPRLPAPVHYLATTADDCMAVVRTDAAFASVLGQAIDDAAVPGVLGTVAGDDTVFVALTGSEAVVRLSRLLGRSPEDRRRS